MTDFDQFENDDDIPKSKTQIKREMEALQDLGKKLLGLSKNQLKKVEMSDTLREAFVEAGRIKQHEAMRRHLQYIGKIMRTGRSRSHCTPCSIIRLYLLHTISCFISLRFAEIYLSEKTAKKHYQSIWRKTLRSKIFNCLDS